MKKIKKIKSNLTPPKSIYVKNVPPTPYAFAVLLVIIVFTFFLLNNI